MADREQVQISVGGRSYTIDTPVGLSDHEVITRAIMADPEFAQAAAQAQAHGEAGAPIRGAKGPTEEAPVHSLRQRMGDQALRDESQKVVGRIAAAESPVAAGLIGEAAPEVLPGMVRGGLAGGGGYLAEHGIRGQMPTLKGTAIATGTGAIAGPLLEKYGGGLLSRMARRMGLPGASEAAGGTAATAGGEPLPEVVHAPMTPQGIQNMPEGNVQNIPRGQLPGIARRTGDPAVTRELERLNTRVLHVPEEGYSGRRLQGSLADRMGTSAQAAPASGGGTSSVGLVRGEAPRTNPSQEAASKDYEIRRNQAILDHPDATDEDRASAANMIQVLRQRGASGSW